MTKGGVAQALAAVGLHAGLRVLSAALRHLPPGDRAWLARRAMQDRFGQDQRRLAQFFANGLAAWNNHQYDVELSGEAAVLRRLARFAPKVLFDIGANVGDWSVAALEAAPGSVVHAFEIDPRTAVQLSDRMRSYAGRIVVNDCGLADFEGEATIAVATGTSKLTRLVTEQDVATPDLERHACRVMPGDTYVARHGISAIDLIKMDVEGAEQKVLAGFRRCFERGAIAMVQFEYPINGPRQPPALEGFHRFFREQGFVLGKVYPEGVAFKEFEPADEDQGGPNFLACRRDRTDIIEALRCEPLRQL